MRLYNILLFILVARARACNYLAALSSIRLNSTSPQSRKSKQLSTESSAYDYRFKSGANHLTDFIGVEPSKKRKRRTSFTPQALELLNAHFDRNTHPSGKSINANYLMHTSSYLLFISFHSTFYRTFSFVFFLTRSPLLA